MGSRPNYKEGEFAFYLEYLGANALIVAEGDEMPALAAAAQLGIPLIIRQAILMRSAQNGEIISRNPLRFLRSSSSSMPVAVIHELERTFGAPLIEAYGMTEAAHQMASNPLPPAARKLGTVGRAAGPEVAIMDETGNLSAVGIVGEIVIRGENVTGGYENNPKANAENFTKDWFRTGDLGAIDEDGYLSISGKIKEIINRGGEKISPREVDEVLMQHPTVMQTVTFGIPHDKLGEEVGAAIVCKAGSIATEKEFAHSSVLGSPTSRR